MLTSSWMPDAGVLVAALFMVCVAILFYLRDPLPGSARRVSHAVWCPRYKRVSEVMFREGQGRSGLTRIVQECPLRGRRERCGEACALAPAQRPWLHRMARHHHAV